MIIVICVFLLLLPSSAYAYLDPGSGSMIIAGLVAVGATLFYFLKSVFYDKKCLGFLKNNKEISKKYGIVFYNEAAHYWQVFSPIIRELNSREVDCTYLTSDSQDPGMDSELQHVKTEYIGTGHEAYFFLNQIKADMVIMTTPGLDVLQIKRSKKVKHYSHIVHGLEDTSTYESHGVDYFDSVLVNGKHQLRVIRELETARGLEEKIVKIIGSTYLDFQKEKLKQGIIEKIQIKDDRPTVLLAPSWGGKGFLGNFGEEILDKLTGGEFNIILRPHPQSFVSEKKVINRLKDRFSGIQELVWDQNLDGLEAMKKSDIMISDFSGIVFDYSFLFYKPVFVFDFQIDPRKYDMNSLESKQSTLMRLFKKGKIGYRINKSDLPGICGKIQQALKKDNYIKNIDKLENKISRYPGQSGKRGADFIQETVGNIRGNKFKGKNL